MKSVDVLFDGPPHAVAGRFVEVHDSETNLSVSIGEWIKREDGLHALRIPVEQPWLLVSEIDLTDPVAHPIVFIVRVYADGVRGEYHCSLEEYSQPFKNAKYYWRDNRNDKTYPFHYFKYYQPITGPEESS